MWGMNLNRNLDISLKRQIYQNLRDQMLAGTLKAGDPLPSTRELAKALSVSRNTVNEAYEMLIVEGYAESRQGAPTRVAEGLILNRERNDAAGTRSEPEASPLILADFKTGQPDLRLFPRYVWQRAFQKALSGMPADLLGYTGPQGLLELRQEIASWLMRSKGIAVDAGDIFITAGATQALHLVSDLLYAEHQFMLVEDPCNIEMIQTFIRKGYTVVPVPVDAQGIRTETLCKGQPGPVYVTPSHQFPLGGILPASRRTALIRFARSCGSYIVEDDYDSEFRYYGEPASPLYAMAPERVIYIGTFSKVLFPALRIGYVIVPRELQKRWRRLRTYTDVQNPPFEQAALAEFLRTRTFDRHITKMRKIYKQRRQILLDSLGDCFGDGWRPWGDAAGLHLAVEFDGMVFNDAFRDDARRNGIRIAPVEHHCLRKGEHHNKLLLGYGHLEPEDIRSGIYRLREFMKQAKDS